MSFATYGLGIAPIVTVTGPGNLHHMAYASGSLPGSAVGMRTTTAQAGETTNFLLGFSYTFTGYAFYWDGAGPAFWRMAGSQFIEPVGNSWTNATSIPWDGPVELGVNVEAEITNPQSSNGTGIIVYTIPYDLD